MWNAEVLNCIPWDVLALGLDMGIFCYCSFKYKKGLNDVWNVQNAPRFTAGPKLVEAVKKDVDCSLPYACVEGVVGTKEPIESCFIDGLKGVVQHILALQHRSNLNCEGTWTAWTRVQKDITKTTPFFLYNDDAKKSHRVEVHVESPLSSTIQDNLEVVYCHFLPTKTNLFRKSVDVLLGDVSIGIEDQEKMLRVGAPVLAFGRLAISGGDQVCIKPPDEGYHYIITTGTVDEVMKKMTLEIRKFKIFAVVFGGVAVAWTVYLFYKYVKKCPRCPRSDNEEPCTSNDDVEYIRGDRFISSSNSW